MPVASDLRQEPGAGKPHAGICAGGRRQLLSLPRQTSGADFVGPKAYQAAGQDGDEGDLDESDEVPPLEDRVQPAVAADPGQGGLNPNPLRNEGSAVAAGAGLEGDAKLLAGQPLTPVAV